MDGNTAPRTRRPLIRRLLSRVLIPLAKRKIARTHDVRVLGFDLTIPPTVFDPSLFLSSKYFAQYLQTLPLAGKSVLEIGCGSGILSLAAARAGAIVTAIDLNPEAVICSRDNASRNNLAQQVTVHVSDQFQAINEVRFDLVFSNPPYYTGSVSDISSHAWMGGINLEFFKTFAGNLGAHLSIGGNALMILSEDADIGAIRAIFQNSGFAMDEIDTRRLRFEQFFIYKIVPKQ